MARIRTIKPEYWDDELIASLSRDARLLFIATWNFADDEGRLRWAPAYIKSKVFPYDTDLDETAVAELMKELEQSGRVHPYVVSQTIEQTFAVVINFGRHQRINRAQDSSLPAPPNPETSFNDPALIESGSRSDRSTPEGKGREGKGTEGKGTSLAVLAAESFPIFWAAYPRKIDKRTAEKAYFKALERGTDPKTILAAAEAYADSKRDTELRFVKHPSSWLNADSFENVPEPRSRSSTGHRPYQDAKPEDFLAPMWEEQHD